MSLTIVEQVGRVHRAGAKKDINHGTAKADSRVQTAKKDQKQIAMLASISRTATMPLTGAGTQRHVHVSTAQDAIQLTRICWTLQPMQGMPSN